MKQQPAGAHRRVHIGISGSYGGMNLGDEAILESIVNAIRASLDAQITVFSLHPEHTLMRHSVEHALNPRAMTRREITPTIQALDVFILGGGGILYDREAQIFLREVSIAHEAGVPVLLYAISAGPLVTPAARLAVQQILDAAPRTIISVRDRIGQRLLDDLGVSQEVHLTADPAFLLKPQPLTREALKAEGVEFNRPLVGFSVREPGPAAPDIDPDDYHALLAHAADFIVQRYEADVLFVPMELVDVRHSHAVVAHMRNAERAEILRRSYSARQILDLMGRFEFVVGMRLHFLIFAALRGVPFAPLPYATKVSGLLEDLKMDSTPMSGMGVGQLLATIDRKWDTRDAVRATIKRNVPALKRRAAMTHELLLQLLETVDARKIRRMAPRGRPQPRRLMPQRPQSERARATP